METPTAVTERIKTFNDLQTQFGLQQSNDGNFFTEWFENLPELSEEEKSRLDRLRQRYLHHRGDGLLLEGTVNFVVVSPLLELAGFLDPPFKLRSPQSVTIEIEDPQETLKGLIDVLIVREHLWILVLESKRNLIPVTAALPQILAYLMATAPENNPENNPLFGLATNGDTFVFVKVDRQGTGQYDISESFTLLPRRNKFEDLLRVLKRLGQENISSLT